MNTKKVGFACVAIVVVAACSPGSDSESGSGSGTPSAPGAAPPAASTERPGCERLSDFELAGLTVAEAVALDVSERQIVLRQQPQTQRLDVRHCRVTGVIDSSIRFELLMPDEWNGKFMMGGGGGFVGSVQNQAQLGPLTGATALERGYATAGTDTGHTGDGMDASWALDNPMAKENFAHRAVHRTAEVSKALITEHYGAGIDHSYFLGCSRGGGQAMISAQRYPEDFDGIVAGAPALDWPGFAAAMIHTQQHVYPDPESLESPVITGDNRRLLADAVRSTCDAADGVADGILNDPRTCSFDPADLPRCEGQPGPDCVTDEQLEAIQAIYAGPRVNGEQLYPGFPYGSESGMGGWNAWITGGPDAPLPPGVPSLHYGFGTEFFKYFVFDDPEWTYEDYAFENWPERAAPLAELLNATDPALGALRDRGGKVILWHGWSDAALTALDSIDYYEAVEQRDPSVRDYFRMFLMPGVEHCGGGPGPDRADWITAIERWVEDGNAPDRVRASSIDAQGSRVMTRPLCPYPATATYDGRGDPNAAESFSCSTPPGGQPQ